MQLSANNIEHILLISCALYVFVECFACARQVIAAERGIGKVPTGFRNKLSLAAHQKAAAFTSESAQSRLVLAFVFAAFAVLMTTGHGLTYLTALFETLTDNTLLVQWSLLVSIMGLMVVVSLPLEWLIRYRLRERFGYQRRSRKEWFKRTVGISTAGLAAALPATALLLILCEVTGPYWWLLLWMLYLAWLFWRWRLSLMRGQLWSRASRPIQNEALRRKVRSLLAEEGFRMEDLVIMTRPPAWKYAHVLLPGSGELRRVVVFADTAAKLTEDELLAVIASQAARIKFHHGPWRIALSAAGGFITCAVLGWAANTPVFFEGLGFSPILTVMQPGTHAGFAMAAAVIAFPIVFFPLRALNNFIIRQLRYAADRCGAAKMGGDTLARALAKLHRDYTNTLTPSRFYSVLHYDHPHAAMRVAHLLKYMRARKLEPHLADPAPALPTVLSQEQAITRALRRERTSFNAARREAEEALTQELLTQHDWVDDDGFEDDPSKTGKSERPTPKASISMPDVPHIAAVTPAASSPSQHG